MCFKIHRITKLTEDHTLYKSLVLAYELDPNKRPRLTGPTHPGLAYRASTWAACTKLNYLPGGKTADGVLYAYTKPELPWRRPIPSDCVYVRCYAPTDCLLFEAEPDSVLAAATTLRFECLDDQGNLDVNHSDVIAIGDNVRSAFAPEPESAWDEMTLSQKIKKVAPGAIRDTAPCWRPEVIHGAGYRFTRPAGRLNEDDPLPVQIAPGVWSFIAVYPYAGNRYNEDVLAVSPNGLRYDNNEFGYRYADPCEWLDAAERTSGITIERINDTSNA